jgi:hypothetical protein
MNFRFHSTAGCSVVNRAFVTVALFASLVSLAHGQGPYTDSSQPASEQRVDSHMTTRVEGGRWIGDSDLVTFSTNTCISVGNFGELEVSQYFLHFSMQDADGNDVIVLPLIERNQSDASLLRPGNTRHFSIKCLAKLQRGHIYQLTVTSCGMVARYTFRIR